MRHTCSLEAKLRAIVEQPGYVPPPRFPRPTMALSSLKAVAQALQQQTEARRG